ncbi:MAG: hypothetical protein HKO72_10165 [Flavobacteriaceae bacterium]|nr:hypothetical protein [Bacteroidia bacterium]NNK26716.1 hypothetical protein [Flavobacteriaceae bacterium]NNL61683.1 hypothetical protein [Flavobacteriaceae bacterium]
MKRLSLLFTALLLLGTTVNAETTKTSDLSHATTFVRGYGNSFIFVERGIEFSVFPDGQFDFYMSNYGPNVNAGFSNGNVSISFNSGYDYNPYVQYDDFGAIIQIENVPIFYDYYGRIVRAGDVRIRYNNFGRVARVGGLYIHYNNFNVFSHCTGFINPFNRFYTYRPWHRFYTIPARNFCVVYNRPYRQFYTPIRHSYYRPYRDNFRPRFDRSYSSSRRGKTAYTKTRRSDRYKQGYTGRRGDRVADNSPRRNNSVKSPRRIKGDNSNVRPRRGNSKERVNTPRRKNSSGVRNGTPRNTKPRVVQNERPRRQITTPRTNKPRVQKPRVHSKWKSVTTQNRRTPIMKQRSMRSKTQNRVAKRPSPNRSKASMSKGRSNTKSRSTRARRGL